MIMILRIVRFRRARRSGRWLYGGFAALFEAVGTLDRRGGERLFVRDGRPPGAEAGVPTGFTMRADSLRRKNDAGYATRLRSFDKFIVEIFQASLKNPDGLRTFAARNKNTAFRSCL